MPPTTGWPFDGRRKLNLDSPEFADLPIVVATSDSSTSYPKKQPATLRIERGTVDDLAKVTDAVNGSVYQVTRGDRFVIFTNRIGDITAVDLTHTKMLTAGDPRAHVTMLGFGRETTFDQLRAVVDNDLRRLEAERQRLLARRDRIDALEADGGYEFAPDAVMGPEVVRPPLPAPAGKPHRLTTRTNTVGGRREHSSPPTPMPPSKLATRHWSGQADS